MRSPCTSGTGCCSAIRAAPAWRSSARRCSMSRRPRSPGAARPPRPGANWPPGLILRRPVTCCAATTSCGRVRWRRWASAAPRRLRSRWGTGWPTRTAGPPCAASWPKRSPPTSRATRWPSACRSRPPGRRWAWPTGPWSRRWPGTTSSSGTVTCGRPGRPKPGRPRRRCRRGWPRRCGPSWRTWPRRRSWPRTRPGCGSSGSTRRPSRPPPGPGCCSGSLSRSCWPRARRPGRRRSWPGCPSRSPPPRPGRRSVPPGGSRSPCWSTWTGPGSPSASPTTAAACG
jgi:hypothetical protein